METHVIENKVELSELSVRFIVRTDKFRQCPAPFSDYYASSSGKIIGRTKHVLSTLVNNAGYEMVNVYVDGKYTTTTVHRLVALAWVKQPKTDEKLVVDHINDDKLDNNASNLRWVTYHTNLVKHHRMETMSGNSSYSHGRAVVKISENGRKDVYKSISAASRDNDLSVTSIQGCCNHTLHLNRPYRFEFAQSDKQMEEK
jgi:hypothetical protein